MLRTRLHQYLFACLLLFVLFFLQFLRLLDLSGLQHLASWWKSQNYLLLQQLGQPLRRLQNFWNLSARLEDLQYRYSEAAATAIQVKSLERENQELRRMLENTDRNYSQVVISAPLVSFAQSFVAAGQRSGVQLGSAVLHQGTLLGLIDQVEERQSRVLLLSRMGERALLAQTNQGVLGLVRGSGREILLTEVPADAELALGDLVYTKAQEGIKEGLLIGRVVKVDRDNKALATQTAAIEQLVDFFAVALVEIQ